MTQVSTSSFLSLASKQEPLVSEAIDLPVRTQLLPKLSVAVVDLTEFEIGVYFFNACFKLGHVSYIVQWHLSEEKALFFLPPLLPVGTTGLPTHPGPATDRWLGRGYTTGQVT